MKNIIKPSGLILLTLLTILIHSCKKDNHTPPIITTTAASVITQTTATSGGNITSDGGATVTARGVCWSTTTGPTTALSTKTTDNTGTGIFTSSITALTTGTVYYVRAYATNSAGTSYGDLVSFKTSNFTFALVDISKETKWDYWLIDKNKDSFFFKVTAGKPTVMLLNLHNSNTSIPIFFNDQGFPEKVIIDNQIFIFQNYSGKYVDIAAILPNGTIDVVKSVETQINWDLYKQKGGNALVSGILNYAGRAVGFVPCGLSVAAAFGSFGAMWLLPAWTCGNYFLSLSADIQKDEFGVSNGYTEFFGNYGTSDLIANCPINPEDCFFSAASTALDMLADDTKKIDDNKDQINTVQYIIANGFKVTTSLITSITDNSVVVGGSVTTDGVNRIDERGVFYGTSQTPEISGNKLIIGSGTGNFTSTIYGLNSNTSYYIKAYARSGQKTEYGSLQTIKTVASQVVIPTLSTTTASSIASTSATSGGNITSNGGATVTASGVCWSTTTGPTTALSTKTTDGSVTGSFTSSITGLTANTTYYVKAYATNSVGTAYGTQVSFTTSAAVPVVPTLTTTAASSITQTTATSGGNISSDGGATVTARGVCWSTSANPTTALTTKTSDGTGTGAFTSSLTGLTANTTYYVRAYATNSIGTAYGTQVSFTTAPVAPVVPTLSTTTASSITTSTASSGGNITSDGGASVTVRGICWSTSANPTITLSTKTSDGTGTGVFTSSITGLTANTTYYVRAYATNSVGTGYGTQVSFTTTSVEETGRVTDIDGNIYNTATIGTQVWMVENLKTTKYNNGNNIANVTNPSEWFSLTSGAFSWYNNEIINKDVGALYNYYAVSDARNLCPAGWHVPTMDEWNILFIYLGGFDIAGSKMILRSDKWIDLITSVTNESGFSALPAGERHNYENTFFGKGYLTVWLTSSVIYGSQNEVNIRNVYLGNDGKLSSFGMMDPLYGLSVRCVKN